MGVVDHGPAVGPQLLAFASVVVRVVKLDLVAQTKRPVVIGDIQPQRYDADHHAR
jgi:hypothetical protein